MIPLNLLEPLIDRSTMQIDQVKLITLILNTQYVYDQLTGVNESITVFSKPEDIISAVDAFYVDIFEEVEEDLTKNPV